MNETLLYVGPQTAHSAEERGLVKKMKIFISWSGDRSRLLAESLKDWLSNLFTDTEPWMSAHDILAGSRWGTELSNELASSNFGILCLTAENFNAPWLLFEAGSLAKQIDMARVVPYRLQLSAGNVGYPLAQFQGVDADEAGTLKLVQSINEARDAKLPAARLHNIFTHWWPALQAKLTHLSSTPIRPSFLTTLQNRKDVEEWKTFVLEREAINACLSELARSTSAKSISIVAAYHVGGIAEALDDFKQRDEAELQACFADMFVDELLLCYQRKFVDRTKEDIHVALKKSLRQLLGPCNVDDLASATKLGITGVETPPRAQYEIRLTQQRLTYAYYRVDNVAIIVPLDMKTYQKPQPLGWLLDKETAPRTFQHYLDEYKRMFDQARLIFPLPPDRELS